MKAIRIHEFGGPEVLKLEETPVPTAGDGQVLIRIHAVGVNPVDTYIRSGKYGPKNFPFTPGDDSAGVVEAVGTGVKQFKPGDRVYTDKTLTGSYAQLTLCQEQFVHCLPDRITFKEGCAIGIAGGTAFRGLFQRGRGIAGETVLIHGATGGVGTAAVQLARGAGMTVVATASSEEGRKYAVKQGAHHAVDHDIVRRLDEVKSLTGGAGFDLIIELAAHKNLAADIPAVSRGGRIVVIGSRDKIEIDPRDTMSREADILGLMLFGATPNEHRQMYSAINAAMEAGTFRPVVGREMPLADAPKAHRQVIEGGSHGKIVLVP